MANVTFNFIVIIIIVILLFLDYCQVFMLSIIKVTFNLLYPNYLFVCFLLTCDFIFFWKA